MNATKTATKPSAKAVASPAAKTSAAAKTAKSPAAKAGATSAEPSLRFYHSKALRKQTDTVLGALEAAPEKAQHADAVADLVANLVEAGMEYYFLVPLKKADVGFLKEQSARLGMSGAVTLINSVSRKFIVRMESKQLLVVSAHIRSLT